MSAPAVSPAAAGASPARADRPAPARLDAAALQAHVDLHARIDADAAQLKAWLALAAMTTRRAVAQKFAWAFSRGRSA